jgi:hypothetical protein
MATFYGTNSTIANAPTPATILKPGLLGGNVRCLLDDYTCVGTEVTGDLIHMGYTLPVGAKVIDVTLHVSALGTGVTLNVGDAEDDDRYISAVDCSGAVVVRLEAAEIAGRNYEMDKTSSTSPDTQIIIDVHNATTVLTASATIKLVVLYTVE